MGFDDAPPAPPTAHGGLHAPGAHPFVTPPTPCGDPVVAPWHRKEPLTMFVDTHCHLDHHRGLTAAAQVARAREADVSLMVTVGTDMASSTQAVQTAAQHDDVHAVVGIHPNDAMEATPAVLEVIDRFAADDQVVGVGETGMDFYRDSATPAQQDAAFRAHIDIARTHDKALVIHCRDAWDATLDVLADHGAPDRVVMHCFSGDLDVVEACAEQGWFMSFAGNVTFKNAQPLRAAAAAVPPDLLLTETDSPFLTPHPHRGTPNDPSMVPLVLQQLARVTGIAAEELAATVADNAARAFDLPAPASHAKAR